MNTIKTFFLMVVLSGVLLVAGLLSFGIPGLIIFLCIALVMNFFAYWSSDKLALKMAHAHEVSEIDDRELHLIVDEQVRGAGIPKPRVYLIESDSPNAFATGRNQKHASIAVTTGIRRLLNREELGAVIAHELAHVGNKDTLIMTMVATMVMTIGLIATAAQWAMIFGGLRGGRGGGGYGFIVGIAGLLVVMIVLPLVATLVRMAISRAREYQADATGARTSGNPYALASALEKLEEGTHRRPMKVNEAVAHLYIVNPLSEHPEGGGTERAFSGGSSIFSTHPPIRERVRRLREMRQSW